MRGSWVGKRAEGAKVMFLTPIQRWCRERIDGEVAVAEVVVDADGHPVAQAALLQSLAQGAHPFVVAVVGVAGMRGATLVPWDGRRRPPGR